MLLLISETLASIANTAKWVFALNNVHWVSGDPVSKLFGCPCGALFLIILYKFSFSLWALIYVLLPRAVKYLPSKLIFCFGPGFEGYQNSQWSWLVKLPGIFGNSRLGRMMDIDGTHTYWQDPKEAGGMGLSFRAWMRPPFRILPLPIASFAAACLLKLNQFCKKLMKSTCFSVKKL